MLESSVATVCRAIETRRTSVPADAQTCSRNFGKVCKVLWPDKTAEHLASRARCGVRAAGYYLAGSREPPPRAILAVIIEILD